MAEVRARMARPERSPGIPSVSLRDEVSNALIHDSDEGMIIWQFLSVKHISIRRRIPANQ